MAKMAMKSSMKKKAGGAAAAAANAGKSMFKFNAANMNKFAAVFYGMFALQFAFAPDFLVNTNFVSQPIDDFHRFIMRGLGILAMMFCYLTWRVDPKKFLLEMTLFNCVFSAAMPFYAHQNMNVKLPDHYLPVGGCALLCLGYVILSVKQLTKKH